MNKFELFMGCLGNGITVCNKAIEEHGDYKTIAHISPRGNIKLYVTENIIPQESVKAIRDTARYTREEFLKAWNKYSVAKQYEMMLDELPWATIKPFMIDKSMTLQEKVTALTAYYMTNN